MDTLAFALTHSYCAYEDNHPATAPYLRCLPQLLPSSGWLHCTALLVAVAIAHIPTSSLAIVRSGDTGEPVQNIQSTLIENGYQAGEIDGMFGPQTRAAVRDFQQDNQLLADGRVGPETAAVMGLANANDANSPYAINQTPPSNTNQTTNLQVITKSRPLNVRSGPGTEYSVVGTLSQGSVIEGTNNRRGNWQQLANGNWVSQRWVTAVNQQPDTTNTPATRNWRVNTNGSPLNVRNRPSLNAPVINTLANGTVVSGQEQNGWIALSNGGWIAARWTTASNTYPTTPDNTIQVNTNGTRLNVRSGPGINYPIVGSLSPNATARSNGVRTGNWTQLDSGNWVASQWIRQ
jgi:peptidoglycan hydrolase-like protein with peptidoglycan-binding domain